MGIARLYKLSMKRIKLTDTVITTRNLEKDWGAHEFRCNSRQKQLIAVVDKSLSWDS